jgi:feruloyl esterase
VRLFMVPGMGHCGGGDGATTFDMVAALDRWVTFGNAPAVVPASRVREGQVDRTRPLCAYPQFAVYKGNGSTDDAANFECRIR